MCVMCFVLVCSGGRQRGGERAGGRRVDPPQRRAERPGTGRGGRLQRPTPRHMEHVPVLPQGEQLMVQDPQY